MLTTFGFSCFCVLSRGVLNSFDRKILHYMQTSLQSVLISNAIIPLLFALLFSFFSAERLGNGIGAFIVNPGVILSGVAAQIAAAAFSYALKSSPVRSVIISAKMVDLCIPLLLFLMNRPISSSDLLFSLLTTAAFIPLAVVVFREKQFHIYGFICIGFALLFQVFTSTIFQLSSFTKTWGDFLNFMVAVLVWRTLFALISVVKGGALKDILFHSIPRPISVYLVFRGLLAFLSQASFFLCITSGHPLITWPILNAGPLLSCYIAHGMLGEKTARFEAVSTFFFSAVCCFYFYRMNIG